MDGIRWMLLQVSHNLVVSDFEFVDSLDFLLHVLEFVQGLVLASSLLGTGLLQVLESMLQVSNVSVQTLKLLLSFFLAFFSFFKFLLKLQTILLEIRLVFNVFMPVSRGKIEDQILVEFISNQSLITFQLSSSLQVKEYSLVLNHSLQENLSCVLRSHLLLLRRSLGLSLTE